MCHSLDIDNFRLVIVVFLLQYTLFFVSFPKNFCFHVKNNPVGFGAEYKYVDVYTISCADEMKK
jgi:hypothetical protein